MVNVRLRGFVSALVQKPAIGSARKEVAPSISTRAMQPESSVMEAFVLSITMAPGH